MYSGTDDRRADALAAGKKRSVKDRVGVRKGGGGGDGHGMHRHHGVVTGKGDGLNKMYFEFRGLNFEPYCVPVGKYH